MPEYYFDLVGPSDRQVDEMGLPLPDLDHAYLEGHRAILDMSREMMKDQIDPGLYRFEVRDREGTVLEIPFLEVLRPGRGRSSTDPASAMTQIALTMRRNETLRQEVTMALGEAQSTMTSIRAALAASVGQNRDRIMEPEVRPARNVGRPGSPSSGLRSSDL